MRDSACELFLESSEVSLISFRICLILRKNGENGALIVI